MSRLARLGIGATVVAALILVAGWFDGAVMREAQRQVGLTFDPWPALLAQMLGYLLIAGGCLGIGAVGWRLRSVALGILYVVGGAFFAGLDLIWWRLAASVNDTPPFLPQTLAQAVGKVYAWQTGPLNATLIMGAATLLVGVFILVASIVGPSFTRVKGSPSPNGRPDSETT